MGGLFSTPQKMYCKIPINELYRRHVLAGPIMQERPPYVNFDYGLRQCIGNDDRHFFNPMLIEQLLQKIGAQELVLDNKCCFLVTEEQLSKFPVLKNVWEKSGSMVVLINDNVDQYSLMTSLYRRMLE